MYDSQVAAVREGFDRLWQETHVRCSRTLKRHLVLDRLRGHAERGKGSFNGLHVNGKPVEWYCMVLDWKNDQYYEERKAYVRSIYSLAERAAKHKGPMPLCDDSGLALLGIGFLRWISVDPVDLLTGLYLGGMRDQPTVRAEVDRLYGERLMSNGHHTHSSDDGAIVAAGMMLGFSAACGVWLADALDSLEKGLSEKKDADCTLAEQIINSGVSLSAGATELHSLTYVCTIPEHLEGQLPDCSLREMLTIDPLTDQTGIESHLLVSAGKPYAVMPLTDGEMSNREFYKWVRQRVDEERERISSLSRKLD